MHLCFLINPTDDWQQAVEHAHQLALATKDKHNLTGVFFYGTAANIITNSQAQARWKAFANTPLLICRTMVDDLRLSDEIIAEPFEVVGMASWILMMEQADRIVEII